MLPGSNLLLYAFEKEEGVKHHFFLLFYFHPFWVTVSWNVQGFLIHPSEGRTRNHIGGTGRIDVSSIKFCYSSKVWCDLFSTSYQFCRSPFYNSSLWWVGVSSQGHEPGRLDPSWEEAPAAWPGGLSPQMLTCPKSRARVELPGTSLTIISRDLGKSKYSHNEPASFSLSVWRK